MTQDEKVAFWAENLPSMQNKKVQVTARQVSDVDVSPGQAPANFSLVNYVGIVQNPAVQMYPPDLPPSQQVACLFVTSTDQLMQTFAIALSVIEEVDDEFEVPEPTNIAMSGLTKPS